MTHTERVHVLFGLGLALMGVFAFDAERRRSPASAALWPALGFVIGLLLFIPVEANTRTYTQAGWIEVFRTIVPDRPATWIPDWFDKARAAHVTQHKIGGLTAMFASLIEVGIARGWLPARGWRHVLPIALLLAAVVFGVHGGTTHHLPSPSEQVHHHVLGVGLGAAGVSLTLFRAGVVRHRAWGLVWPVVVALVGLNLMFFYRLPSGAPAQGRHAPVGVGPASEAP